MIIHGRPPNFEQIRAAFPGASNDGVMFAYDGCIYSPSERVIPPALIAHEEVHLKRQKITPGGADRWWGDYIRDSEYRYFEEMLAHAAEFKVLRSSADRNQGARLMVATALRLIAPLYNYQPPRSLQEAMKDLRREIAR